MTSHPNMGDPQSNPPGPGGSRDGLGRPGQMPILTDEEKQMMRECERDSFYKRALPISFGAMLAAQGLVSAGRWAPHPRFGAFPKMIITGGVGYFLGKISYLPVCQQKILERIPNSNLANAIRKSKGIPQQEGFISSIEEGADEGAGAKERLADNYSASNFKGLDESKRPSIDREVRPEKEDNEERKTITYDEMRRRNRQEYEDNMAKQPQRSPGSPSYKDSPFMPQRPWPERSRPSPNDDEAAPPPQAPAKRKRTNMWGDVIED